MSPIEDVEFTQAELDRLYAEVSVLPHMPGVDVMLMLLRSTDIALALSRQTALELAHPIGALYRSWAANPEGAARELRLTQRGGRSPTSAEMPSPSNECEVGRHVLPQAQ